MAVQASLFPTPYERAKLLLDQQIQRADVLHGILQKEVYEQEIEDVLIPPSRLAFRSILASRLGLNVTWASTSPSEYVAVHRHALGQLLGRVHVPIGYANLLLGQPERWGADLLAKDLTEIYEKADFLQARTHAHFLLRIVNDELRGFLSNKYATHLSTYPLLLHFLDYCQALQAKPVEALISRIRISVKCVLPMLFEPVPQQPLCIGMMFHNSDFGAGSFTVTSAIWDPRGGTAINLSASQWSEERSHLIQRVHLGPTLKPGDLALHNPAREARTHEVSKLMATEVKQELSTHRVETVLDVIRAAHARHIPWPRLKRSLLGAWSLKDVRALEAMIKTPPPTLTPLLNVDDDGFPLPTSWWAAAALALHAKNIASEDPDKAYDLQCYAGNLLSENHHP